MIPHYEPESWEIANGGGQLSFSTGEIRLQTPSVERGSSSMGILCFAKAAGVGQQKVGGQPTCPECGKEIRYPLARQRIYQHLVNDHQNEGWNEQDASSWAAHNVPIVQTNHFASAKLPAAIQRKIASMGLVRCAGNVYEAPSTKDFWMVSADGGIRRLCGDEVDNGESIAAAPKDQPMQFLESILDDLSF